jgi:hypothetical protein
MAPKHCRGIALFMLMVVLQSVFQEVLKYSDSS